MDIRSLFKGSLFIAAIAIAAPASTARAQSVTVTQVNPAAAKPGEQVAVTFTVAGASNAMWAQVQLAYSGGSDAGSVMTGVNGNGTYTAYVTVNQMAAPGNVNAEVTIVDSSHVTLAKSVNSPSSALQIK